MKKSEIALREQNSISIIKDSSKNLTYADCINGIAVGYTPKRNFVLEIINELNILHKIFGLEANPERLSMLSTSIVKNYSHETYETLIAIIRKGANGLFKEKIYGRFTPHIFAAWAAEYLEDLYLERERLISNAKVDEKPRFNNRDEYIKAVKIGNLAQKEIEEAKTKKDIDEHNYQNFKAKYLNRNQR